MVNNAHQKSSCVWKCLTGKDKQWYVCFSPVTPCSRLDKQLETISAVTTPSFCRHNKHKHTMHHSTFPFVLPHSYISSVNIILTWRTLLPYRLHITHTGCGLPSSQLTSISVFPWLSPLPGSAAIPASPRDPGGQQLGDGGENCSIPVKIREQTPLMTSISPQVLLGSGRSWISHVL